VGDTELRDVVPQLPSLWDEPFADSSQIPTYLVAKLAREHVTVALSGDGGDELFCGYDRYRQGASMMRRLGSLPRPLRAAVAGAVQAIPARAWGTVMEPIRPTPQGKEPMASGCTGSPITWPRRTPMRSTACWCRAGGGPKTLFWARQRRRAFWPSICLHGAVWAMQNG
jgi:hypothetical protein